MPLRSEIDPAGEAARPRTGSSWRPIFEGIHNAIVRHRIEPGARLAEEEIAEIYGVSRTVVRAALQALARDGVVILERNKGARVAQPSPEEAREIFEARAAIEPEIARRAAERRDAAGAARLRALIAAEHEALDADRRREVEPGQQRLHMLSHEPCRDVALATLQRVGERQMRLVAAEPVGLASVERDHQR